MIKPIPLTRDTVAAAIIAYIVGAICGVALILTAAPVHPL